MSLPSTSFDLSVPCTAATRPTDVYLVCLQEFQVVALVAVLEEEEEPGELQPAVKLDQSASSRLAKGLSVAVGRLGLGVEVVAVAEAADPPVLPLRDWKSRDANRFANIVLIIEN